MIAQQKPRVLLLNWRDTRNPLAGGAENHIAHVFGRLAQRGWRIHWISAKFEGGATSENVGNIYVHRCGGPLSYPLGLPLAYRKISATARPDLVIEFVNKLPLFSPLFVGENKLCFVHHLFGTAAGQEVDPFRGGLLQVLERTMPFTYSGITFIAGAHSTIAELQSLGIARDKLNFIPYGVDCCSLRPGTKASVPTIIYLGRLKRYKGIDQIIKSMPALSADLRNVRLEIVGVGDDSSRLEDLVCALGQTENVRFHGWVSESRKLELLQEAWVNCLPSCKEGFGLTIPEAALCGTPTVGYDVPGLRDAIVHRETGLLAPSGNSLELKNSLRELLTDGRKRQRLADAAFNFYKTRDWEVITDQWESFLQEQLRAS